MRPRFSAVTTLTLIAGDRCLSVAKSGPDRLMLLEPLAEALPPGDATVLLTVDGREHPRSVRIAAAVPAGERFVSVVG